MDKVCPRCGASNKEKEFLGSFCADCAAARVRLEAPRQVEIKKCRHCERIYLGGWVPFSLHAFEDFLLSRVKGDYASARLDSFDEEKAVLVFTVHVGEGFVEAKRVVNIVVTPVSCEECSRKHGGYFEAILQIRGEKESVGKLAKKLSRQLSRKTFVTKTVETKRGIDFFVGSRAELEAVLSEFRLKHTKSAKLAGVKDGQRYYRVTYCVRV